MENCSRSRWTASHSRHSRTTNSASNILSIVSRSMHIRKKRRKLFRRMHRVETISCGHYGRRKVYTVEKDDRSLRVILHFVYQSAITQRKAVSFGLTLGYREWKVQRKLKSDLTGALWSWSKMGSRNLQSIEITSSQWHLIRTSPGAYLELLSGMTRKYRCSIVKWLLWPNVVFSHHSNEGVFSSHLTRYIFPVL